MMPYLMILVVAPALTCIIELPIVKGFRLTNDIKYIVCVNVLTNLILNCGGTVLFLTMGNNAWTIWNWVMELLFIPVSEAFLYRPISAERFRKILLVSYLANAVSWGSGYVLSLLIK